VLAGKYGADVTIQNMVSPFLLPAALRCPCVVLLLLLLPLSLTYYLYTMFNHKGFEACIKEC